jgi:hypothetical protein
MVMIICDDRDAGAFWAVTQFQKRGIGVELVTASALEAASRWHHAIVGEVAETRIDLADGRIIDSARPQAILNRLSYIPTDRLRATAGTDYGYALQEYYALYLSWLGGWPAVVLNRAVPQGLCGNHRTPSEWIALAYRAGLPAVSWKQSDRDPQERVWQPPPAGSLAMFVCTGAVVANTPVPTEFHPACVRLAELAGCDLLGMHFERREETWVMTSASPMPELSWGGDALAEALAGALAASDSRRAAS